MATCTECGDKLDPKYLAARVFQDMGCYAYEFFWACRHFPADDCIVRLGSKDCVEKFCEKHPECVNAIIEKMTEYEKECHHEPVN